MLAHCSSPGRRTPGRSTLTSRPSSTRSSPHSIRRTARCMSANTSPTSHPSTQSRLPPDATGRIFSSGSRSQSATRGQPTNEPRHHTVRIPDAAIDTAGRQHNQMAVRISLTRVGATKQPTYRLVVADGRSARDGRAIDTIGHYNPRTEPIELSIDEAKARDWLAKGAQPSDTVARLFRRAGVL